MSPTDPDFSRLFDSRSLGGDRAPGDALRRAASAGELTRLRPSVYRTALPPLAELHAEERRDEEQRRFLEAALAVGLTRRGPLVFAGETAAAIHGFPRLGAPPRKVEVLEAPGSTRRTAFGLTVRIDTFRDEDLEPWGEFLVTTPARTLADLAKWCGRAKAIAALDFALSSERAAASQRVTRAEIEAALAASAVLQRRRAAEAAIAFADARSGSVGESVSRVLIDEFGFPAPMLQVRHAARSGPGRWYFTDFEWPDSRTVGEFDGRVKYLKPELRGGRDASQLVVAEKLREDALRAEGFRVVRWTWDDLVQPQRLRAALVAAGLRPARALRRTSRPW